MNEKIIFAKYNSNRRKQFQIATKIIKTNTGEKYVRKIALSKESESHLKYIADRYSLLKNKYKNNKVSLVECCYEKNSLIFPYVSGESVENRLDEYLKQNDIYSFQSLIKDYFDYVISLSEYGEIALNNEFECFFGQQVIMETAYIAAPVNIDLIFSNIIINDDVWYIIDYEWIYDFKLPVKYLLYRAMSVYLSGNLLLRHSVKDLMLRVFELDENDIVLFKNMEEHFQEYVNNNEINKLKNSLKKQTYDISNIQQFTQSQEFQVFLDYGEGFCEENSYKIYLPNNSIYNLNVKMPTNVKAVRIDPGNAVCEIRVVSCSGKNKNANSLVQYSTNGLSLTNNRLIFLHNDPQIIIEQTIDVFEEINILLSVNELSFDFAAQLVANINETQKLREQITNEQSKCVEVKANNALIQDKNNLLHKEVQKLNEHIIDLTAEKIVLQREKEQLLIKLCEIENEKQALVDELQRINNSTIGKLFFAK